MSDKVVVYRGIDGEVDSDGKLWLYDEASLRDVAKEFAKELARMKMKYEPPVADPVDEWEDDGVRYSVRSDGDYTLSETQPYASTAYALARRIVALKGQITELESKEQRQYDYRMARFELPDV